MFTRQSASSVDFDWQQLRQLAGEDANFETELLTMFLHEAEKSLYQLEQAIAAQSVQAVENIAHSLRGASANVGAIAFAAVAFQLEQTARRGEIQGAHMLLQQLYQHYRRIRQHL